MDVIVRNTVAKTLRKLLLLDGGNDNVQQIILRFTVNGEKKTKVFSHHSESLFCS